MLRNFRRPSFHSGNRAGGGFRGRAAHTGWDRRAIGNSRPMRNGRRNQPTFDPTHLIATAAAVPATAQSVQEYVATHRFADFPIHDQLKRNILSHGYNTPTPIQDQAIEHVLQGRDVVGTAGTGTGKTAAFLIPLIDKILRANTSRALIMTPTRELALQIQDEFRMFSDGLRLFSTLCIGGASMGRQIEGLSRRPHFVIGTPGRLKDLDERGRVRFSDFDTIVLDEVDRMLDMGFIRDMQLVISKLPAKRHSLFFAATMTDKVRGVMQGFLTNPVFVMVKQNQASDRVNQSVISTRGRSKVEILQELLRKEEFKKVLVFGRTKFGIERLGKELAIRGFRVSSIHGNKNQGQRQRALREFRDNRIQALLATDVASRGLDIDNVTHVINFDLPETLEDYIHRIGRTGRADNIGTALTFVE